MAGSGPGTLAPFLTEKEGALVWTLTNNGYKFYTLNLVRALEAAGCRWKLCIFCADSASYNFFVREGILARKTQTLLPDYGPRVTPYIAKQFREITQKKLELFEDLSSRPEVRVCVYLDGDITIYRDPLPDLLARLRAGGPGLLFQCDENTRVACARTLTPGAVCPNLCSGVVAWRHGAVDTSLFRIEGGEVRALWARSAEDQAFLNKMITLKGVEVETLPRDLYPNEQFVSLFKAEPARKGEALLLHYNYMVGNQKGDRMIGNGDWRLPY